MTSGVLKGRTIVVTRARAQAADLVDGLAALGAEVLEFPTIRTVAPEGWDDADRAAGSLAAYDWIVFTSANAVRAFLGRLAFLGVDPGVLRTARLAAVGPSTAARLDEQGLTPDLVPGDHRAEGVLGALVEQGVGAGSRVLIPRALEARELLPESLRERGAVVDVVPVYRTVLGEGDPVVLERLRAGGVDAVTFTSSSTAANFLELVGGVEAAEIFAGVLVASIGPVTSKTLQSLGVEVGAEGADSTVSGLIGAIVEHYAAGDP